MPRSCCVLGCESNARKNIRGPSITTFCFPHDERRKNVWLQCINREDLIPTNSSAVCIRHFREDFIVRESIAVREDGFVIVVHRKRLKLAENAYPSLYLRKLRSLSLRKKRYFSKTKNTCEEDKMIVAGSKRKNQKNNLVVHNEQRKLVKKAEITQGRGSRRGNECERRRTRRAVVAQRCVRPCHRQMRSSLSGSSPAPISNSSSSAPPPPEPNMAMADHNSINHTSPPFSSIAPKMNANSVCTGNAVIGGKEQKIQRPIKCIDEKPVGMEVIQSCCVFGCFSNLRAPLVTMFPFPQDEMQRRLWLQCIDREEFVPTQFSAVCIHHFKEEFILREIKTTRSNGVLVLPTERPSLAPGAFPSLFIGRPLGRPTRKRRGRFPGRQRISGHKKCMVKEENDLKDACINNLKEENHLKETHTNNLKEENHLKEACINNLKEENLLKETCVNNLKEENHFEEAYIHNVREENSFEEAYIQNIREENRFEEAYIHNVKENRFEGACIRNVKEENHFEETINNVKDEPDVHEQLLSIDSGVGFYLSPTAVKEEFEDEVLIGF